MLSECTIPLIDLSSSVRGLLINELIEFKMYWQNDEQTIYLHKKWFMWRGSISSFTTLGFSLSKANNYNSHMDFYQFFDKEIELDLFVISFRCSVRVAAVSSHCKRLIKGGMAD